MTPRPVYDRKRLVFGPAIPTAKIVGNVVSDYMRWTFSAKCSPASSQEMTSAERAVKGHNCYNQLKQGHFVVIAFFKNVL